MASLQHHIPTTRGVIPIAIRPSIVEPRREAGCGSALERIATTMHVARNEAICHDGDVADACFRIVSGCVRVSKTLSDGRRHVVDFLYPGDFFGFTPTDEYDGTAEAITSTVLKRYPRGQLEAVAGRDIDACNLLRRAVGAGLATARARGMMLARLSAEERLAAFLVGYAGRAPERRQLPLPMTRADIGDYLGLTIETVSRTFTKFRARGWIKLGGAHDVHLVDLPRLTELSEGAVPLAA
jgi:CRP-like cAMP-binding protein